MRYRPERLARIVGILALVGSGLHSPGFAAPPATFRQAGAAQEQKLREPTEAERKAVIAAIEAQLKAFRADDFKTAEKYQHSSLRDNFNSTEEFRAMMRRGYPQVVNYKSVSFGAARCDEKGEQAQIHVTLTGKDGVTLRLVYVMLKEEGEYRVATVFGGSPPRTESRDVA